LTFISKKIIDYRKGAKLKRNPIRKNNAKNCLFIGIFSERGSIFSDVYFYEMIYIFYKSVLEKDLAAGGSGERYCETNYLLCVCKYMV
jgi:hypothetical protein